MICCILSTTLSTTFLSLSMSDASVTVRMSFAPQLSAAQWEWMFTSYSYFQRWRRRSLKTRWCWQESNIAMKTWRLHVLLLHSQYFNKNSCMMISPIRWTDCFWLDLSFLYLKRQKHINVWITSQEAACLLSFFHLTPLNFLTDVHKHVAPKLTVDSNTSSHLHSFTVTECWNVTLETKRVTFTSSPAYNATGVWLLTPFYVLYLF